MHTRIAKTGEGDGIVECHYHIDSDGDIDEMRVMAGDTDITQHLTLVQIEALEDECLVGAEADYLESKDDSRIDAYLDEVAA